MSWQPEKSEDRGYLTGSEVRGRMVAFLCEKGRTAQEYQIIGHAFAMFDKGKEPTHAELAMLGVERCYRLVPPVVPGDACTKVPEPRAAGGE